MPNPWINVYMCIRVQVCVGGVSGYMCTCTPDSSERGKGLSVCIFDYHKVPKTFRLEWYRQKEVPHNHKTKNSQLRMKREVLFISFYLWVVLCEQILVLSYLQRQSLHLNMSHIRSFILLLDLWSSCQPYSLNVQGTCPKSLRHARRWDSRACTWVTILTIWVPSLAQRAVILPKRWYVLLTKS